MEKKNLLRLLGGEKEIVLLGILLVGLPAGSVSLSGDMRLI
jgi:hypothetical protein